MNKESKEIICIETKGAEGFIEDISDDNRSMTIEELINYLEYLSDGNKSKKVYLTNDDITYTSLDSSKFEGRYIKER